MSQTFTVIVANVTQYIANISLQEMGQPYDQEKQQNAAETERNASNKPRFIQKFAQARKKIIVQIKIRSKDDHPHDYHHPQQRLAEIIYDRLMIERTIEFVDGATRGNL